jgi:hypothetical protein
MEGEILQSTSATFTFQEDFQPGIISTNEGEVQWHNINIR